MIKTLEKSARTEDEAIAAALAELGLDRDDVSVEIVERAKSGFLGIGASPAVIRVSYEAEDEPAAPAAAPKAEAPAAPAKAAAAAVVDENEDYAEIRRFLTGLLERMGVTADIEISPRENGGVNVNLSGSGMGAIIGRRGETLDAIQQLTNYSINRGSEKNRARVQVDVENYREKREQTLRALARRMAYRVQKYKKSVTLEPMNPYERRIIHSEVQNIPGVTTISVGNDTDRKIIIYSEEVGMPRYRSGDRRGYNNGGRGGYRSNNYGDRRENRSDYESDYEKDNGGDDYDGE